MSLSRTSRKKNGPLDFVSTFIHLKFSNNISNLIAVLVLQSCEVDALTTWPHAGINLFLITYLYALHIYNL